MKYFLAALGSTVFLGIFLFLLFNSNSQLPYFLDFEELYGILDLNEIFGDPIISISIWGILWAALGACTGYSIGISKYGRSLFGVSTFILFHILAWTALVYWLNVWIGIILPTGIILFTYALGSVRKISAVSWYAKRMLLALIFLILAFAFGWISDILFELY